jgi:hypothetical protein
LISTFLASGIMLITVAPFDFINGAAIRANR